MGIEERLNQLIQDVQNKVAKGETVDPQALTASIGETLRSYAAQDSVSKADVEKAVREAEERVRGEMEKQAEEMLRSFALAQAVREVDDKVDSLVAEGRIPPTLADTTRALMVALLGVEGNAGTYAAEDIGAFGEMSLPALFQEFLAGLPTRDAESTPPAATQNDSGGAELYRAYLAGGTQAMKALAEKVEAIKKANPGISHYEAYRRAIQK